MSESTIRFGVIGAGWFASRRHIPELQALEGVQVVALCRRDPDLLARMAAHFSVKATYTDYRRMLVEEPLDAVLIATPHALHFEHAREALEQGLHVLLEKPMTLRYPEACALVDLARKKGKQLAVALNPPYWAHCHLLRQWIGQGRLGPLESVDLHSLTSSAHVFGKAPMPDSLPGVVPPTLFRGDPSLGGGGILVDGGSHLISELLWVAGLRVTRVHAAMDDPETDLCAALLLETSAGVPCTLNIRADSRFPQRRTHHVYYGARGTAVVEGPPFRLSLRGANGKEESAVETKMPPVPTPSADFVAAIRSGRTPLGSAEHGAAVVAVIEAAYRSARSGQAEGVEQ